MRRFEGIRMRAGVCVVCVSEDGCARTMLPRLMHHPVRDMGALYDWGYEAASYNRVKNLAWAILKQCLDEALAERLHAHFAVGVLRRAGRERFAITEDEIFNWVAGMGFLGRVGVIDNQEAERDEED